MAVVPRLDALEPLFQRGAAQGAVAFEPGLAEHLARGLPARVLIVSDGKLSRPLTVKDYAHVEALVTDVTKLERHGRAAA